MKFNGCDLSQPTGGLVVNQGGSWIGKSGCPSRFFSRYLIDYVSQIFRHPFTHDFRVLNFVKNPIKVQNIEFQPGLAHEQYLDQAHGLTNRLNRPDPVESTRKDRIYLTR